MNLGVGPIFVSTESRELQLEYESISEHTHSKAKIPREEDELLTIDVGEGSNMQTCRAYKCKWSFE